MWPNQCSPLSVLQRILDNGGQLTSQYLTITYHYHWERLCVGEPSNHSCGSHLWNALSNLKIASTIIVISWAVRLFPILQDPTSLLGPLRFLHFSIWFLTEPICSAHSFLCIWETSKSAHQFHAPRLTIASRSCILVWIVPFFCIFVKLVDHYVMYIL